MKVLKETVVSNRVVLTHQDIFEIARKMKPSIPDNAVLEIRGPGKRREYHDEWSNGDVVFTWKEAKDTVEE